jgi:hypothetical protein
MKFQKIYSIYIFTLLFFIGFFAVQNIAYAGDPKLPIQDENYSVKFVSQSEKDPIKIEVGETKTITFQFKNIGTKTWDNTSSNYISAYTVEPKYRDSLFSNSSWLNKKQTAKLKRIIKPNSVGELEIKFTAPEKTGKHVERFHLASENRTWVKNGYFFVIFDVVPKSKKEVVEKKVEEDTSVTQKVEEDEVSKSEYKASLFMQGRKKVVNKGGEKVNLKFIYQNTGDKKWNSYEMRITEGLSAATKGNVPNFADATWKGTNIIQKKSTEVLAGGILSDEVYFRTPRNKGEYTLRLSLYINGELADADFMNVSVNVTEDAPTHYKEPTFGNNTVVEKPRLTEEPNIRVGLYKPDELVQFISFDDDYIVFDKDKRKGILKKGSVGMLKQEGSILIFTGGGLTIHTTRYIRLQPENDKHSVFELRNYDRLLSWKTKRTLNKYRGALEYRFTKDHSDLYIINELPFEDYIAGIGESSDTAPMEYIKALLTSARTYAYYIKEHSTKHDKRNFDVVAHTGDQLYIGYVNEEVSPNVVRASRETKGYMITYKNNIVITPYFGNTNGRTRAWTEKWGGSTKPWLLSVPAVYDKRDNKSMFGHGVGMSQRDAAYRAYELDENWEELIQYYYTDVEIVKMYK